MKQLTTVIIGLLITGLGSVGCINFDHSAQEWYNSTKNSILQQSDFKEYSIQTTFEDDSSYRCEHFYSHGHEFMEKCFKKGKLRYQAYYSRDGKFELRRELYENGVYAFEGITYDKEFYGLSTWRHSNGLVDEQGVRFKGDHIGIWKKWDENNKLTETDNYRYSAVDSMPHIETQ